MPNQTIRIRFLMLWAPIWLAAVLPWPTGTAQAQESTKSSSSTSPLDVEGSDTGSDPFDVRKVADLRYCTYPDQKSHSAGLCDVFLPHPKTGAGDPDQRRPVVVLVHGGAWVTGNKWTMERHARQLAQKGFAAVTINYRLAPASKFPDQVDDVRSALVWVSEQAQQYPFDLQQVGLYGYSAGGHLVSLVATLADEPWTRVRETTHWAEDDPRWQRVPAVRAVCAGGPPTDFRNLPPDSTLFAFFLGGSRREFPEVYAAASPVCFASAEDPSFRIIHGEADDLVPIVNAESLYQALAAAKVDVTFRKIPGKGHLFTFISRQFSDQMLSFFEQQLLRN